MATLIFFKIEIFTRQRILLFILRMKRLILLEFRPSAGVDLVGGFILAFKGKMGKTVLVFEYIKLFFEHFYQNIMFSYQALISVRAVVFAQAFKTKAI